MSKRLPAFQRTLEDVELARQRGDVTANGVAYFTKHSAHRFHFILAREACHTDGILHEAKIELRKGREFITLQVERFDI